MPWVLCRIFPPAAGVRQYSEHVGEGTSVSWLHNKDGMSTYKHEKGNPNTNCRDNISYEKAHILLNISYPAKRHDCTQVDAPVEPVKKSTCCLGSTVFHLNRKKKKKKCYLEYSYIKALWALQNLYTLVVKNESTLKLQKMEEERPYRSQWGCTVQVKLEEGDFHCSMLNSGGKAHQMSLGMHLCGAEGGIG